MKRSMVGKLIKAAALSVLTLTTMAGAAAVAVMAAGPALSQPDSQGGGSVPGLSADPLDPSSTPTPTSTPPLPPIPAVP